MPPFVESPLAAVSTTGASDPEVKSKLMDIPQHLSFN
jgi:hypothetical protein